MQFHGEDDIGTVKINITESGDSAVIYPDMSEFKKLAEIERLPILLSRSLFRWMSQRPHLRIRSTLGILEDGYTVAIHVWFDRAEASR